MTDKDWVEYRDFLVKENMNMLRIINEDRAKLRAKDIAIEGLERVVRDLESRLERMPKAPVTFGDVRLAELIAASPHRHAIYRLLDPKVRSEIDLILKLAASNVNPVPDTTGVSD